MMYVAELHYGWVVEWHCDKKLYSGTIQHLMFLVKQGHQEFLYLLKVFAR
jgi:hypothetical protein